MGSLVNLGACPDEWSQTSVITEYEEGDRVSKDGLVFACKGWPYSSHCGQMGYEPNGDNYRLESWKDAWTIIGYCSGSIGPTSSPVFDIASSVGACPDEWVASSPYEEGDMVSEVVSSVPSRSVVYRCRPWPYSGHCKQFAPLDSQGGSLGWVFAGSCDRSMGPTASPAFEQLGYIGSGCPAEYSRSRTDYEAGDQVSVTVSSSPERKVVYQCRKYPNNGFCNQIGFEPGKSFYDRMAWDIMGSCTGTLSPTGAPAVYTGNCHYRKCVMTEGTEQCDPGSFGCSCSIGQTPGPNCQRDIEVEQCTNADVNPWVSNLNYDQGDVIRVGTQRYKCRPWPYAGWCKLSAYRPPLEPGIWTDAWEMDGNCLQS